MTMFTNSALVPETVMEVKRFHPDAIVPQRQSAGAVGHDLHSVETVSIGAHKQAMIGTGVGVRIPHETYARVAPRSGMSLKGIDVLAGVVDPDWTSEIKVIIINHSDAVYQVRKGDRIAQLILERVALPIITEVTELRATERGANGFGSTGA